MLKMTLVMMFVLCLLVELSYGYYSRLSSALGEGRFRYFSKNLLKPSSFSSCLSTASILSSPNHNMHVSHSDVNDHTIDEINVPIRQSFLRSSTQFFNSLTKRKELFVPLDCHKQRVTMYCCGPTVYDDVHVGNLRAFLSYDLIKRWLMYLGYDVEHVINITDIDDKIIQKMYRLGLLNITAITQWYEMRFHQDLEALNILPASKYPRVTDHINSIVNITNQFLAAKQAYVGETDGCVYFDVNAISDYGQALKHDKSETVALQNSMRDSAISSSKKDCRDFVLWKQPLAPASETVLPSEPALRRDKEFTASSDEPSDNALNPYPLIGWATELGFGRPGWHIECAAMCYSCLGPTIDIHAGGSDLRYPHHENELAISKAFTGRRLANYWLHNGFVTCRNQSNIIEGSLGKAVEKMSKSMNNYKTLRDICSTPTDLRALRLSLLSAQYRSDMELSHDLTTRSRQSIVRLDRALASLTAVLSRPADELNGDSNARETAIKETIRVQSELNASLDLFERALSDDLNTPVALSAWYAVIKLTENIFPTSSIKTVSLNIANEILKVLLKMDSVLGLFYTDSYSIPTRNANSSQTDLARDTTLSISEKQDKLRIAEELCRRRKEARLQENFALADEIRTMIQNIGYRVVDNVDRDESILLPITES